MGVGMHMLQHTYVTGQSAEVGSLLPACGLQGWNSGCKHWRHGYLPAKWPKRFYLIFSFAHLVLSGGKEVQHLVVKPSVSSPSDG